MRMELHKGASFIDSGFNLCIFFYFRISNQVVSKIVVDNPHLLYRIGLHLLVEEEMDLDAKLVGDNCDF